MKAIMKAMKTTTVKAILFSTLILSSYANALDFNAIINENSKAQNDLHAKIQETVTDSQVAAEKYHEKGQAPQVIVDNQTDSINVKSKKGFLKFAKEKTHIQASQKDQDKRLAQELKEVE